MDLPRLHIADANHPIMYPARVSVCTCMQTENTRDRPAISNNIALPTLRRHRRRDSRPVRPARKVRRELISLVHTRERRLAFEKRRRKVVRYPSAHEGLEKYSRPWGRISRANLTLCAIAPRSCPRTPCRRLPTRLDRGIYGGLYNVRNSFLSRIYMFFPTI